LTLLSLILNHRFKYFSRFPQTLAALMLPQNLMSFKFLRFILIMISGDFQYVFNCNVNAL